MTFDSIYTVFYTSLFLIPGYIIEEITASLMPRKKFIEGIIFLRCLAYSILNCAVWSWAYLLVMKEINNDSAWYWLLGLLITTIGAFILGVLLGVTRKRNIFRKIFNKLGIQIEHPIPTSWDYKFSNTEELRWVIVTLVDDKCIYGKYSLKSFTSSDQDERDIYLEEVYTFGEDGTWSLVPRSDGILIIGNSIKHIEFYKP